MKSIGPVIEKTEAFVISEKGRENELSIEMSNFIITCNYNDIYKTILQFLKRDNCNKPENL